MKTRVHDVMTSPVETVGPAAGFKEIVARMRARSISALPVIDETGKVLGVVSEADLLLKEERANLEEHGHRLEEGRHLLEGRRRRAERTKAAGSTAAELMTSPAVTIGPDAWVAWAALLMHQHGVKRLPVVDGEGRTIGIVSRGDLLKVFTRPDEEIRREIVHDVIEQTLLLVSDPFTVKVEKGVVSLGGAADRKTDAQLIERLARRVDGVVDVRSELTYHYDDTKPVSSPPLSPRYVIPFSW